MIAAVGPTVRGDGQLRLRIEDEQGMASSARIVVTNARGRETPPRAALNAGVGVVVEGEAQLRLRNGDYRVEFSRGPEYRRVWGTFKIESDAEDSHSVQLERIVTMAEEGWVSGDPLVSAQLPQIELQMRAEDLHVAGVFAASSKDASTADTQGDSSDGFGIRNDCYVDDPQQPALLAWGASPPLSAIADTQPRSDFLRQCIQHGAEGIVVVDPAQWELPILLASERIDGIMVLGPHVTLGEQRRSGAGRPPALPGYLNDTGAGRWAEYVYWQVLEAGLPIPAVAGSGTPIAANPVGYNRCYVAADPDAADTGAADPGAGDGAWADEWWQGLKRGRCVITNGPLLRPRLDGFLPGHHFQTAARGSRALKPACQLAVRDPVDYLEIVQNGTVAASVRLAELADSRGELPTVTFDGSGWVLIRCVTQSPDHCRMAMSSPWWVDVPGAPRISRSAVQFFQQWLEDYVDRAAQLPPERRERVAPYIRAARRFWDARLAAATVD